MSPAECPRWVTNDRFAVFQRCPLLPQVRPIRRPATTVEKGQQLTSDRSINSLSLASGDPRLPFCCVGQWWLQASTFVFEPRFPVVSLIRPLARLDAPCGRLRVKECGRPLNARKAAGDISLRCRQQVL